MADVDEYTDAQLKDGTILRFKGKLEPDAVRTKVAAYRAKTGEKLLPSHKPTPPPATPVPKDFLTRAGERFGESVKSGAMFPAQAMEATGEMVSKFGKWVGRAAKSDTREAALKEAETAKQTGKKSTVGKFMEPWGDSFPARVAGAATAAPRALYRAGKAMGEEYVKDPAKLVGDIGAALVLGKASEGVLPEEASAAERTGARTTEMETVAAHDTVVPEPLRRAPFTAEQQVKYTEALDKATREHATNLAEYADKEASRRASWVRKAYGAKQSEAAQVAAAAKRQVLDRGSEEYAVRAQQNIRATHQTVRSRLDSRWHQFRESMNGAEVSKVEVYNIIREARDRLRGSPADLKQFNDLAREIGISVTEDGTIEVPAGEVMEMPIETVRVHSTAIGNKLAAGGLPGNVYQALKQAKTGIEEGIIEPAAESRGQGEAYRALKHDWSQYMSDWNDMSSVATAEGSPLARALRAPDVQHIRPIINGINGDMLLERLGKYRGAGSQPSWAQQSRSLFNKAKVIKAGPVKAMPPEYEPLPVPQLKEVPLPKPPKAGAKPSAPAWVRGTGRVAGKLGGAAAGTVVGHPFIGYAAGGEAGGAIAENIWRRRIRGTHAVPPELELPQRE
jgi:hypothetical protein